MPTAIGTVLASARGAEWVHAAPPSQRERNCSEQVRRIAGHHFVLFWSDPEHEWYHHCDMAKQTAITRQASAKAWTCASR
jgi:hypothetical protein